MPRDSSSAAWRVRWCGSGWSRCSTWSIESSRHVLPKRVGVQPPDGKSVEVRDAAGEVLRAVEHKPKSGRWVDASPALSQMNTVKGSIKSRRVAVLLAPGFDAAPWPR